MNRSSFRWLGLAFVMLLLAAPLASATTNAIPALRVDGSTTEATGPDGATASYTVKADDPSTGPLPATCDNPAGTSGTGDFTVTAQFPLGTTVVTCTTTDSSGTVWSRGADVVVQDTTPPSISPTANITTSTTDPGGTTVNYNVPTATDLVDGTDPVTCSPASGTSFSVGNTTVTCTSSDAHQNTATSTFTVTVVIADTTPPVVTVPADMTREATSASGAPVTFSASATDNVDGTLTPTCNPSSGATFPLGATTVTCTATDGSGNTGTASFTVTVVDTTPPTVVVAGDMTVDATSPSGAAVTFSAGAADIVDGTLAASCNPSSGATFPFGTTTVTCSATDSHGNTGTASFTVTVVDRTPPSFQGVPSDTTVEANGSSGSVVHYTTPTATDDIDGPIAQVTCAPVSGSLFGLGATSVTCSATDSHGNTGTASFTVQVVDTTPPHLIVPGDASVYASSPSGAAVSDSGVEAWLATASASDLVDPHPTVTNNAPSLLPVGTTTVTFVARDASGNTVSATAKITVFPQPPPGTTPPPLPPPPDRQPPDDVGSLVATAGDGVVSLTWKRPTAPDFAVVVITRSTATGADASVVYRGAETSFVDHAVTDGVQYRYVVVAVDKAGNSSVGVAVVALPKRSALSSPKDGAHLRKPPRLVWAAVANARYYNVQLFRGTTKILSAWPVKATFVLHARWTFEHVRYRLTPGAYHWYVWPGFGPRADANYGAMLGSSTFVIGG